MNLSFTYNDLPPALQDVVRLKCHEGKLNKQIAYDRGTSVNTVNNQIKVLNEKTETKGYELAAWYFITRYKILPTIFLAIICTNLFFESPITRTRTTRARVTRVSRRDDEPVYLNGFEIE